MLKKIKELVSTEELKKLDRVNKRRLYVKKDQRTSINRRIKKVR